MMKKLLLACLVGALSVSSAYAESDGEWREIDSGRFYVSNMQMPNWWSAASWCEANGMRLATIKELCPRWDGTSGNYNKKHCQGLGQHVWSATAKEDNRAYAIDYASVRTAINASNWERTVNEIYAACIK